MWLICSFFAGRLCFNYVSVNQIVVNCVYLKYIDVGNYWRGASVLQAPLYICFPLWNLVQLETPLGLILGVGDQVLNFPCQSSGTALAALPRHISMADFPVCVFDTTGCKEKTFFAEASHWMIYSRQIKMYVWGSLSRTGVKGKYWGEEKNCKFLINFVYLCTQTLKY